MKRVGMILVSCLMFGCNFTLEPWSGSLTTYETAIVLQNQQEGTSLKLEPGAQYHIEMVQQVPTILSAHETWKITLEDFNFNIVTNFRTYMDSEYVILPAPEIGQGFDLKIAYTSETTEFEGDTYSENGKCFTRFVYTDEVEMEFLHPATRAVLADGLLTKTATQVKEVHKVPCR